MVCTTGSQKLIARNLYHWHSLWQYLPTLSATSSLTLLNTKTQFSAISTPALGSNQLKLKLFVLSIPTFCLFAGLLDLDCPLQSSLNFVVVLKYFLKKKKDIWSMTYCFLSFKLILGVVKTKLLGGEKNN